MIAVDPEWWDHLTPPAMHARRSQMDAILQRFVQTPYGDFWLRHALTPNAVIRLQPGQVIPTLHVAAFGDDPAIPMPWQKVVAGHRFVGANQLASGRPVADGELVLSPVIQFELVTDPAMLDAIRRRIVTPLMVGTDRPAQLFSIPARYLLRPEHRPGETFVLYQHIFGHPGAYPVDGYFYVGITRRSWQARWAEHRRAISNGSRLKFHRVFREEAEAKRITYVHHKIMAITKDADKLERSEEWLVQEHWDDERRLNMIPGGKAGLRRLREWGLATRNSRTRAQNVCSRRDRLSIDQILSIRKLAANATAAEIAKQVGSRNVRQVRGVLSGRTYQWVTNGDGETH